VCYWDVYRGALPSALFESETVISQKSIHLLIQINSSDDEFLVYEALTATKFFENSRYYFHLE
jgi:hypothetical protein